MYGPVHTDTNLRLGLRSLLSRRSRLRLSRSLLLLYLSRLRLRDGERRWWRFSLSRSAVKPVSQNRVVTRAECGQIFDSYARGPNPGFTLYNIGQKREMHILIFFSELGKKKKM